MARTLLVAFLVTWPAVAQTLLDAAPTPSMTQDNCIVVGAGDLDGDGCADVVIGMPIANNGVPSAFAIGAVRTRSGRTGATLWTVAGLAAHDYFGKAVASVGDLDGDGVPDVAVAGPQVGNPPGARSGYVRLLSGRDGSLILHIASPQLVYFGSGLAAAGDVDLDGVPDVIAGAPGPGNPALQTPLPGAVCAVSGATGKVLAQSPAALPGNGGLGLAVAGGHDLGGDGRPDIIAGVPALDLAWAFSGADGSLMQVYSGPWTNVGYGSAVASPGDVSGDGLGDVLVSQPKLTPGGVGGLIRLHSGPDSTLLLQINGDVGQKTVGQTLAAAGDLDDDGMVDLATSAEGSVISSGPSGLVRAYSLAKGSLLLEVTYPEPAGWFGRSVAGAGDTNGDGTPDIVVSRPGFAPQAQDGRTLVLSGAPLPWVYVPGAELPGLDIPKLVGLGEPVPAGEVRLQLLNGVPFAPVTLIAGVAPAAITIKGHVLLTSVDSIVVTTPPDATGFLELVGRWPVGLPAMTTIRVQAWQPAAGLPGSVSASNAVEATGI